MAQKKKSAVDQLPRDCGTLPPAPDKVKKMDDAVKKKKKQGRSTEVYPQVQIPIKAHIVRRQNGTGGLSAEVLNHAIATMNTQYQPLHMQFYLCGPIHYIDDDDLADCEVLTDDARLTLHNVNDAINIYFCDNVNYGGSPINGISAFPSSDPRENRIIMYSYATSNGSTLAHEMGHYWSLLHTHETSLGEELVTRGTGANCTTAGDGLCDTPADRYSTYDPRTCTYTDTLHRDRNGELYSPDLRNLMSYYHTCRNRFTEGQLNRMHEGYLYRMLLAEQYGTYKLVCQPEVPAPTQLTASYQNCSVTLNWADEASSEGGYIIERSSRPDGNFVAVGKVAANTTQYTDREVVADPSRIYYYRVVAANASAAYSTPVAITFSPSAMYCYCIPGSTNCDDNDMISNFSILHKGTSLLNHTSSCSPNGYSDYTTSVAAPSLIRGNTYSFTLRHPGRYREGITLWLDFNQNQLFEPEEMVFKLPFVSADAVLTGSLSIPDQAPAGTTRLRVRLQYNQSPAEPCSAYEYGETEDYAVTIVPRPLISSVASGSWSTPATWSCSCVPTSKDQVVIEAGHTITVDPGTVQMRGLEVKDGATLDLAPEARLSFQ